ncbi:MAG TPA: sugar transferase [Salinarimonas sp.]|nr:sugar transferase [Salinarimonas sp.]
MLLVSADIGGFSLAWQLAYLTRAALDPLIYPINDFAPYAVVHPLIVATAIANCFAFGLYIHRRRLSSLNRPSLIFKAGYHWLLYIIVVAFFFKELEIGRSVILLAALYGLMYLYSSRTVLRALKVRALRAGRGTVRSAIIGTSQLALEVKESLRNHPEIGFTLVGLIPAKSEDLTPQTLDSLREHDVAVLGPSEQINELVERYKLEELFLAAAHLDPNDQLSLLNVADRRGISVHVVSNIFGVITESAKVEEISTFPVVTLRDGHMPFHQTMLKRALDLCCAILGVIIWLLFFHWWIAWRIKRDSPGPVFFKQQRVGRDGELFQLWKYRTMKMDAPAYSVAPTAEDDPRITRFGRWLRKTSLDELPQLINVLRGEMSMVGPRPEMPFIVEKYQPWERRRLDVKPGLTGLWQVIGRKNLPLALNMQYDFYYIKNQSFLLDLEILFRTIPAVLKGRGAF